MKMEGAEGLRPQKNGRGGGPPFAQACVVPEHTIWGSSVVGAADPPLSRQRMPAMAAAWGHTMRRAAGRRPE